MRIMSGSAFGLQRLLDICSKFTVERHLVFNSSKTKCIRLSLVEQNGCYLCLYLSCVLTANCWTLWINENILGMFSAVIWVHLWLLRLSSRGSFRRSIRFIIFSRGPHLLCYVACCKLLRLSSMGVVELQ